MSLEVSAISAEDVYVFSTEETFINAGTGAQVVPCGTTVQALPSEPGSATISTWQDDTFATTKEFQIYLDLLHLETLARIAGDENLQRQINALRLALEDVPTEEWLGLIVDARFAELQAQIDALLVQVREELAKIKKELSIEIDAARLEIADTRTTLSTEIDNARLEIDAARDKIDMDVGAAREELGGAILDNKTAIEDARRIIDNLSFQAKELIDDVQYYTLQASDDPVLGQFMNSVRDHTNKVKTEMAVSAVNAQVERNTTAVIEAGRAIVAVEEIALAKIDDVQASFETFKYSQVDENEALSAWIEGVEAKTDKTAADVVTESAARASADDASAKRIDSVQASTNKNAAAIKTETLARATAVTAVAARVDMLEASVDGNVSSISTEQLARANADSVLAGQITAIQVSANEAKARVDIEMAARIQGDTALSTRIENLIVVAGEGTSAAIDNEAIARASADETLASQISSLSATFTTSNSTLTGKINEETLARANADEVLTLRANTMDVRVANNTAAIHTEELARINADEISAGRIDALEVRSDDAEAAITSEATARINADGALSGRIDNVSAKADTNAANISTEIVARSTADAALGSRIDTVAAQAGAQRVFHQSSAPPSAGRIKGDLWFDTNDSLHPYIWDGAGWVDNSDGRFVVIAASVVTERNARVAADDAIAQNITTLTTQVNQNAAAIYTEQIARTTSDSALASDIRSLTTKVDNNTALISSEAIARATEDSALAATISSVSAVANAQRVFHQASPPPSEGRKRGDLWYNTNDGLRPYFWDNGWVDNSDNRFAVIAASVQSEQVARITADSAMAQDITTLTAQLASANASISQEKTVRANEDSALAASISTVSSRVDKNSAAITSEQITRADRDSALAADISAVSAVANSQRVFIQASMPPTSGRRLGDVWYNSADGNRPYYWNGAAWIDNSDNRFATIAASVVTERDARITKDDALSVRIDTLVTQYNSAMAAITVEQTTRARDDSALSASITTLTSKVDRNAATFRDEVVALTSSNSALTSRIQTAETTINGHSSSITTLTQSYNGMMAQWAVQGNIDESKGGVRLTGIKKSDGSGALWKFIIDANTEINGSLVVNGTINTNQLAQNSVSFGQYVIGTGIQSVLVPVKAGTRMYVVATYDGGEGNNDGPANGFLKVSTNRVTPWAGGVENIVSQPAIGLLAWLDVWAGRGGYTSQAITTQGMYPASGTIDQDGTFQVSVECRRADQRLYANNVRLLVLVLQR